MAKTERVVSGSPASDSDVARLKARIAELEAKVSSQPTPGRIWADISKKAKESSEPGPIVIRGLNANPKFTFNTYFSQYTRLREQQADIDGQVLKLGETGKVSFRSNEEKVDCIARLKVVMGQS